MKKQKVQITASNAQIRIWMFIKNWIDDKSYPPTVRDIADAMRYASPAFVARTIDKLGEKGALTKVPRAARTIAIPDNVVLVE